MSDLSFHVRQHVPDADGEELALRIALLKARDYGTALRGRVAGSLAYDLAGEVHDLAGHFVFAATSNPRLKMAVDCCRHMVQAAMLADALEEEWTGLDEGDVRWTSTPISKPNWTS